METTTVALIGAGPIGIELAVALKQQGIDYLHFEAGQIGSTINWYAPGTTFFSSPERISIAGVPLGNLNQSKATKEEYLNYLRLVVRQFKLHIKTYSRVISLAANDNGFALQVAASAYGFGEDMAQLGKRLLPSTSHIVRVQAKQVILAIGDMHQPRSLHITGESLPNVSHYLKDPHVYFNKKVVIVGGKNSAAEAALRLFRIGAQVTLSYRGAELDQKRIKYWIYPELKKLLDTGKIKFLPQTAPVEITNNSVVLSSLAGSAATLTESADFVLLLTGYEQDTSLFKMAGITLEGSGHKPSFNPKTMETNIAGLYVAGTGAAGTQLGGVKEFIETSHVHIGRIINSILGKPPPAEESPTEISALES